MWPTSVQVTQELEGSVPPSTAGWGGPWLPIISSTIMVLLGTYGTIGFNHVLLDCLPAGSSISGRKVLKSPIRVDSSISPHNFMILPHIFWLCFWNTLRTVVFLENWLLYHYKMSLFIPDNFCFSKGCSIWD